MRRASVVLLAIAALPACTTVNGTQAAPPAAPAGSLVGLGESVTAGALVATPLEVVEDSRCPENTRCIQPGRLLVSTRMIGPGWQETTSLTLGEPYSTHGTSITLVSGVPERQANRPTSAGEYRLAYASGAKEAPPKGARHLPTARLDERVHVDGPEVTPLKVLEDSRCPVGVTCVWAGRVRISAAIHLGGGDLTRELVLGEPLQIADGTLVLVAVSPVPAGESAIAPADYRFTFRFDGGL